METYKQKVLDRKKTASIEERYQVMKQVLTADYFLTIINDLTEDGELVIIDPVGNRVAALTYGPEKVFAFVSMEKSTAIWKQHLRGFEKGQRL